MNTRSIAASSVKRSSVCFKALKTSIGQEYTRRVESVCATFFFYCSSSVMSPDECLRLCLRT